MLHFKTSIARSLNKKLETNIEFPIITYLRELCVKYRNHLKKDLPTEVKEEDIGSEPMFARKSIITEHRVNDRSFVSLTKTKFALIDEIRYKRFLNVNISASSSGLREITSEGCECDEDEWVKWDMEMGRYNFYPNTSPATDQDKIIRDFEQDIINAHATFTQTRDPWYREFVKQLFSLGLINLYRHICKGNITHGDTFFNDSKYVLTPKEEVISHRAPEFAP